ncbi:50S ribosomal protein L14 [Candidatus Micrarchaeota archaeon CG1_02_60_51]|nr:MAG: 50S ribosomal protein L14 [Candidatus Micrarchaeota archaeon CG1_02_60_51]PIY91539.1 MAG: 50S ribosomal protein L14 [Candidatus Micrarchaeota archaeon CG_4_10_14_0_8_um_filter_60_7]
MLGLTAHMTRPITIGTQMVCDDNSGAKIVGVIGVKRAMSRHNRVPYAGIGDIVMVSVKKGKPDMIKKKELALIIRQKKEFRRGKERVSFEDNACVIVDDKNLPKGTEIKGCAAREISERYPKVVAIASAVV